MKSLFLAIPFLLCFHLSAQVASFDEMEIEADSTTSVYRSAGKNFVLIKSKRGNSGLNKTPQADAIITSEVTEIVLVYSETEPGAIAEREEANRERWENLLMTYPELFQFSTTYKNVCQCKMNGDAESFKKTQGFYIYINGEVPRVEEPKVAETAPVVTKPAQTEPTTAPVKTAKTEDKPAGSKTTNAPAAAVVSQAAMAAAATTAVEKPTVSVKETPAKEKVKEPEAPIAVQTEEETPVVEKTETTKAPAKKKPVAVAKARKAKDPKACRPACYGYGDEDLQQFFKDNIPLTKKQRRKAKNWVAQVRLQINMDGTIKKAMVTGTEEAFNLQVQEIIKSMNNWNSAVKNGVTVKSEVRFTLKLDKETKSIKPFDIMSNPKGSPRCPCISDSEMFD